MRTPDSQHIYIVNRAGTVHRFDVAARRFLESIPLDIGHDTEVVQDQVQLSRDGKRLYLGVGHIEAAYTGVSERV